MNLAMGIWSSYSLVRNSHNPYFIGMNLAMLQKGFEVRHYKQSQSLFYWNEPCNSNGEADYEYESQVTILILLE